MTRSLRSHLCLAMFAGICYASGDRPTAGWKVYRGADYGFEIAYPPDMNYEDAQRKYLSYIPVCADSNVVCFNYNGDEYEGTNFGAAGLSINVLRDKRTEDECRKIDTGSYPINQETINGIHFYYGQTGGAAMSHAIWGPAYRTFHEKVCFVNGAASRLGC